MNKKEKAKICVERLEKKYPEALCSLEYTDPFQLLAATRLSAQCTDERVNKVTPELFGKYPDAKAMAAADVKDVERIVHSCGFFRAKAADLVAMSKMLVEEYDCVVPDTVEELIKLPGVGRKTANLIVGDIYKKPAVVADTHLIRITNLLGFVDTKDPKKVETEMKKLLEPEKSNDFCHRCVLHGRAVCVARRPKCGECCLNNVCDNAKKE